MIKPHCNTTLQDGATSRTRARNLCVLSPFIGICIQPTFVFPKQLAPLETKTNMSLMIRSFGERNSRLYKYENTPRGDVIVG